VPLTRDANPSTSSSKCPQKAIDEKGESGQTFWGMIDWIEKAQPPIVIIENVFGAPWPRKVEIFEERGYAASFLRLDTKDYYIPHTRQRGYLFAVRRASSKKITDDEIVKCWEENVRKLKRPASARLDEYMLPNDDPRVLRGRARLTAESSGAGESGCGERAGRTDWYVLCWRLVLCWTCIVLRWTLVCCILSPYISLTITHSISCICYYTHYSYTLSGPSARHDIKKYGPERNSVTRDP
jgi:hypothetical protein